MRIENDFDQHELQPQVIKTIGTYNYVMVSRKLITKA